MAVMKFDLVGGQHMIKFVDDGGGAVEVGYACRLVMQFGVEGSSFQQSVDHSSTQSRIFPPSLFQQIDDRCDVVQGRAQSSQLSEGAGPKEIRFHQLAGSFFRVH